MIIVKTDASVQNDGRVGIGWEIEITGYTEGYLQANTITGHDYLEGKYTSMEGEMLALFRGFKEAIRLGERDVIKLLTDCQPLVKKIKNHISVFDGSYVQTIHNLSDHIDHWDVDWVSREQNTVADRQAHVGLDKLRQQQATSLSH
jgi:ribonuclease HI